MKIYNTLTKKVEKFIPHNDKEVTMYTCGPTVYNYAHIGNLRTYLFEDFLEKGLNYLGYNVKRVMNITDVGHIVHDADTGEDKMSNSAKKEGKTAQEIAEYYTEKFLEDLDKMNIKKPKIIEKSVDKTASPEYNISCRHASVGKRRSISGCSAVLVARLNGVQEAVSSILATRTKQK